MKKSIYIAVCAMFLAQASIAQQGEKISNEVRKYVEAKKVEGFENTKSTKSIEPKSIEPRKSHRIGGQEVDEANSAIFKAFRTHSDWKKVVLIADCTASMYPYIGQVVAWHQANMSQNLLLDVFLFNDGDDARRPKNLPKIDGKVGGVYAANPNDMNSFLATLATTIDGGDGDDAPENDLEAILAAQAKQPQAKYYVLIADNSAIRDMSLLPQIKKPVHIILCNGGWVGDYVRLAYHTRGSITLLGDQIDFRQPNKIDKKNIILGGMRYEIE
jgi:hypothetical protein